MLNLSFRLEVSSKTIKEKPKVEAPGPGSYDVPLKPSGPKVSIVGRREEKIKINSPGPIYQPLIESSPSITLKGRPKEVIKNIVPGPGAYDLETLRPSKSAISFGHSQRKSYLAETTKSSLPGPGAYDFSTKPINEHRSPKYT